MNTLKTGTARDVLEQMSEAFDAAELYFGHGTDNAWDEACWLLETALRRQGKHELTADTPLTESDLADAQKLFNARIATRKPLAYLLNEAWFCGLPFYVDERVLVPRSPFAELIDNGFDPLLTKAPRRILDLCTGGGCIGIACALAFSEAEVVLSDISADALDVARINVGKHGLQQRVKLVQSDLFANIDGTFDLIVSNPPYVGIDEYRELPDEYLREPQLGLVTDNDGIGIPLRILERAADFLNPEGLLLLETGATWPLLADARPELPFLWLEFEHGGEGICALRKEELTQ
ncbi:MAG: 50S ribosomal protein L3 N(5)-glutamine methyltransferase [Pseudomonadota bacterium]|nr:50S ribosomal protein L3 N(5)-glutamine methyltransferase [Pseudomonadota bacterium]